VAFFVATKAQKHGNKSKRVKPEPSLSEFTEGNLFQVISGPFNVQPVIPDTTHKIPACAYRVDISFLSIFRHFANQL